ncbi:hypothetical protein [Rhodococcus sp. IEGM 1379]|nr:hypothetical protein [Rhodococcus sp. IEGM 1379]MDI9917422.1 hypothetical protein [Rhodococcus sp. IEGM 1379]
MGVSGDDIRPSVDNPGIADAIPGGNMLTFQLFCLAFMAGA